MYALYAYTDHNEAPSCKLELLSKVGEGTFGVVYKAIYQDNIVAAKIVKAESGTKGYKMIISEST